MQSWIRMAGSLMLAALLARLPYGTAEAAINVQTLGAKYDATQANITFRVYSSRATRIEARIYKTAPGAQEAVKYVMTKDAATSVWSKTASVATLKNTYGITGPIYYGYRAWGQNWTYVSTWTKGSATGFVTDIDANGNRINPNKLLLDPYARAISQDPNTATCTDGTIYASGAINRVKDSGTCASKGIVLTADTTSFDTKPTRALKNDIVYEVHPRGRTMKSA